VDQKPDEERKEVLTARFCKRIGEVIEDLVPTAEILNTYLPLPAAGEDLDMTHEEAEEDEDVPDLAEEDVPNGMSDPPANDGAKRTKMLRQLEVSSVSKVI
jgi:hypothetical protein